MKIVKTAISLRASLFERIDALAEELDIPRSHIFALAAEEFLQRHENRKMLKALNEAYEDVPDREEARYQARMREYHKKMVEEEW
jgi:metal-responsive CopG/Arc/MetJ family transcriptional regulator